MRINTIPISPPYQTTPTEPPHQAPTPSAISAIEDTLDLSSQSRNLPETFQTLSAEDKNTYLQNLARLLKAGIIGTETLQIRGNSYHSFVSTRFANAEITHARTQR